MYTPEEKDAINFKNKDIDRMSQSDSESSQQDDACWPPWKKKCRAGQRRRVWSAGEVAKLGGKIAAGVGGAALGVAEAVAAKNKKESPTKKFINNIFNKGE
jgi:hypothetical protein